MTDANTSSTKKRVLGGFIGALTAGLLFMPVSLFLVRILSDFLFTALSIDSLQNMDDFMIAFLFWPIAIISGAIGGAIGASSVKEEYDGLLKSFLSSLAGILLVSLLMISIVFSDWIKEGKQERAYEMRPPSDLPIPSLSGEIQEVLTVEGFVEAFSLNLDGSMLAYAVDHNIYLWDLEKNISIGNPLVGHTDFLMDMAISPDGHWLLSASRDQTVILWSLITGEQVHILSHDAGYTNHISVAINSTSSIVATTDNDRDIILWDLNTGQELERLELQGISQLCLEFSPDDALLAICSDYHPNGVAIWDMNKKVLTDSLSLPHWTNGSVWDVAFSPDGEILAGAAIFGPVFWDIDTRQPLGAVQKTNTGERISFRPDGDWILSTNDSGIYLWDVATREPVGRFEDVRPMSAEFLPDGRILTFYWGSSTLKQSDNCGESSFSTEIGIWTIDFP